MQQLGRSLDTLEETDMETVSREKMKPASRYKKWLLLLIRLAEGRDDLRTMGEMELGEGREEDDVVNREEVANRRNEGYEGKESESISSVGRLLRLEGRGGAGLGRVYLARWESTLVF